MKFTTTSGNVIEFSPFDQAEIDAAKAEAPGEGIGPAVSSVLLYAVRAGLVTEAQQFPEEYRHLARFCGLKGAAEVVSIELWTSVGEAGDAERIGAVSWNDPAGDDEPAEDEYEVATCIGCGCDDNHACWDEAAGNPCGWIRLDRSVGLGVCSCCLDHVARWDSGDREIAVPVELG